MTDELRDRIWTVIADTLCPGNGGYRLLEYREAAQAVIDEFELELTVHCDDDRWNRLTFAAEDNNTNITAILRELIDQYLKEHEQ